MKNFALVLLLCCSLSAWSVDEPIPTPTPQAKKIMSFPNVKMEKDYYWLINTLRCQKCANQTLADSQVDLADDLRQRVNRLVRKGKSRNEVIDFLVVRFGDRVTYDPPFKLSTLLIWFAPLFILISGFIMMKHAVRKRIKLASEHNTELSESDQQRLQQLLNEPTDNKK